MCGKICLWVVRQLFDEKLMYYFTVNLLKKKKKAEAKRLYRMLIFQFTGYSD